MGLQKSMVVGSGGVTKTSGGVIKIKEKSSNSKLRMKED